MVLAKKLAVRIDAVLRQTVAVVYVFSTFVHVCRIETMVKIIYTLHILLGSLKEGEEKKKPNSYILKGEPLCGIPPE